ncbi:hypothetical protein MMC13_003956 [Lambiella insularis]|nr:hypothetical protein [Lambiella insularis]
MELVPTAGNWPVDPQTDIPPIKERLWVDGCFDFFHHGMLKYVLLATSSSNDTASIGHAGVMLQARQLGKELVVGIHSDEEILKNKGPTVMTLQERVSAVDACRWSTLCVPNAPYVTSLPWVSHYGCMFVIHGDDVTSDSGGEDCYRYVKAAHRFVTVHRTPGISTTDLVGRMLLCTKSHFIQSFARVLSGEEGQGMPEERKLRAATMKERIVEYASDATGLRPGVKVWCYQLTAQGGLHSYLVDGKSPRPGQRIVYVDGGFDLFSSGHIEFLRQVTLLEETLARKRGFYEADAINKRCSEKGGDYAPSYIIAGVHDDEVINHWKGVNYPIMNLYERALCVLQCRFIHCLIISAPFTPTEHYLDNLPYGLPDVVYHGPTSFMPLTYDPYTAAKMMGIFQEVEKHDYQDVNASEIVERIMKNRAQYEERQRAKGAKVAGEEALKLREMLERQARKQEELGPLMIDD